MRMRTKKQCLELQIESVFRAPSPPQVEFAHLSELGEGFWDSEDIATQLLPGPPDNDLWAETIRCPLRIPDNTTGESAEPWAPELEAARRASVA